VANTLRAVRNGAVGLIPWLDMVGEEERVTLVTVAYHRHSPRERTSLNSASAHGQNSDAFQGVPSKTEVANTLSIAGERFRRTERDPGRSWVSRVLCGWIKTRDRSSSAKRNMQPMRVLLAADMIEECITLTTQEMQNLSNENKISYAFRERD